MAIFEIGKRERIHEGIQFDWSDATPQEKAHIESLLEWKGDGFDLRTHISDPKSGMLLKYQPYRRVCNGGEVYFYRRGEDGIERRYSESGMLLDADATTNRISNQPETDVKAKHERTKRVS